jgi:hypothetical protein
MVEEILTLNRQEVFSESALAITAGQTYVQAVNATFTAGAYLINDAAGQAWVRGVLTGSTAPAAGFPRIRFWTAPGDATVLTPLDAFPLPLDALNANSYIIDGPLLSPYFTIEWTQGASPGTLSGIAWVFPESPGQISGTTPFVPPGGGGSIDPQTAAFRGPLTVADTLTDAGMLATPALVTTGKANVYVSCRFANATDSCVIMLAYVTPSGVVKGTSFQQTVNSQTVSVTDAAGLYYAQDAIFNGEGALSVRVILVTAATGAVTFWCGDN